MLQMSQILWILWGKMIVKHQFFHLLEPNEEALEDLT
jgi:hypothetical protein